MTWQPIETAPKDGTRFIARGWRKPRVNPGFGSSVRTQRITWYGKASHVPLHGWCHGRVEDVDLWSPTHWRTEQPK